MADRKHGRPAPKTESTVGDWDDADPSGQTYTRVLFIDSDLTEVANHGGVFDECTFRGVRFNASVHTDAAFVNCTFVRCSFFDVTFTRCKLMGSMFDDCTYNLMKVMRRRLVVRRTPRRGPPRRRTDRHQAPRSRPHRPPRRQVRTPGRGPVRRLAPTGRLHRRRPARIRPLHARPTHGRPQERHRRPDPSHGHHHLPRPRSTPLILWISAGVCPVIPRFIHNLWKTIHSTAVARQRLPPPHPRTPDAPGSRLRRRRTPPQLHHTTHPSPGRAPRRRANAPQRHLHPTTGATPSPRSLSPARRRRTPGPPSPQPPRRRIRAVLSASGRRVGP